MVHVLQEWENCLGSGVEGLSVEIPCFDDVLVFWFEKAEVSVRDVGSLGVMH
jgi:hypothetical protein